MAGSGYAAKSSARPPSVSHELLALGYCLTSVNHVFVVYEVLNRGGVYLCKIPS